MGSGYSGKRDKPIEVQWTCRLQYVGQGVMPNQIGPVLRCQGTRPPGKVPILVNFQGEDLENPSRRFCWRVTGHPFVMSNGVEMSNGEVVIHVRQFLYRHEWGRHGFCRVLVWRYGKSES